MSLSSPLRARPQAAPASGVTSFKDLWWYNDSGGKACNYEARFENGQCYFKEEDTGAEGVLLRSGDWWLGDIRVGIIRLQQLANGTLVSEFKETTESDWGRPTIAQRWKAPGYVDELLEALPKKAGVNESLSCHSRNGSPPHASLRAPGEDGVAASTSSTATSLLQSLPSKLGAQIRTGFSRLQGEASTLRLRQKQQQVITDQFLRQLGSRERLEARLEALQAEKESFTEWCSLRIGNGALSPVMDGNAFGAAGLAEAHSTALQLYEHRRMIHEDHSAETIRSRAARMEASQTCEILCAKLFVVEEELQSLQRQEDSLQKNLRRDQARLATRMSRSITPLHSAELRLLHEKLELMRIGEGAKIQHHRNGNA
jgi:hypothetical protein